MKKEYLEYLHQKVYFEELLGIACFGDLGQALSQSTPKHIPNTHAQALGFVYTALIEFDDFFDLYQKCKTPEAIADYIKEHKLFEGKRLAEIGGNALEQLVPDAIVDSADPRNFHNDVRIVLPRNIVRLDDYEKIFQGKYDVTFTNNVLTPFSQNDIIGYSDHRNQDDAMLEVLAIFSNITDGYSIHGNSHIRINPEKLAYIGLRQIHAKDDTFVYAKTEPRLELFPDGIQLYHRSDTRIINEDGKLKYEGPDRTENIIQAAYQIFLQNKAARDILRR